MYHILGDVEKQRTPNNSSHFYVESPNNNNQSKFSSDKFSSPRFLKITPPSHTLPIQQAVHTLKVLHKALGKISRKILSGNYIKSRKEAEILAIYLLFAFTFKKMLGWRDGSLGELLLCGCEDQRTRINAGWPWQPAHNPSTQRQRWRITEQAG